MIVMDILGNPLLSGTLQQIREVILAMNDPSSPVSIPGRLMAKANHPAPATPKCGWLVVGFQPQSEVPKSPGVDIIL